VDNGAVEVGRWEGWCGRCCGFDCPTVLFDVPEEVVGIGRLHSVAKYGIGEIVCHSGEVLERVVLVRGNDYCLGTRCQTQRELFEATRGKLPANIFIIDSSSRASNHCSSFVHSNGPVS